MIGRLPRETTATGGYLPCAGRSLPRLDRVSVARIDDPVKRPGGHSSNLIENAVDGKCARSTCESTCTAGNRGSFLNTGDIRLCRRSPLSCEGGVHLVPIGRNESEDPAGCRSRRQR